MCALANGKVYINASYCQVEIKYREHDTRNGCLLTDVCGHPLDARNLRELASLIEAQEEKLRLGRERYARMFANLQVFLELKDHQGDQDDAVDLN
jgi:hypothetical protein